VALTKWRRQSFPWFDTLATSRYSYYGIDDEEDLEDAINDENGVIDSDLLMIESQATFTNTTRLSTPHHTILDALEDDSSQSEIQNRHSLYFVETVLLAFPLKDR
jgi:hypothetical protein